MSNFRPNIKIWWSATNNRDRTQLERKNLQDKKVKNATNWWKQSSAWILIWMLRKLNDSFYFLYEINIKFYRALNALSMGFLYLCVFSSVNGLEIVKVFIDLSCCSDRYEPVWLRNNQEDGSSSKTTSCADCYICIMNFSDLSGPFLGLSF